MNLTPLAMINFILKKQKVLLFMIMMIINDIIIMKTIIIINTIIINKIIFLYKNVKDFYRFKLVKIILY